MQPRAAIYARISDADPKVEATADQEKRCRALAEREGYEVVAVHRDDGISAFTGKTRPSWLSLVDGIRSDRYDVVLAVAEDRFTRSSQEKIGFQADCAKHGIVWHTLAGGKVDPATAEGGLMSTITGAIAEYESHVKRERVRASVDRRLAEGKDLGGWRPFGWESDRKTLRENEAQLVRDAHEHVLSGGTLYGIAKAWIEAGVLTSTGIRWKPQAVRDMLLRPRNAGLLVHKGEIIGEHLTPIVTREQHEAVVAALKNPARKRKGHKPFMYLGSGLAICGVCGSPMRYAVTTIRNKTTGHMRRHEYYRCGERVDAMGTLPGGHPAIKMSLFDDVVREAILASPDLIARGSSDQVHNVAAIAELRQRRADLYASRSAVQRLFAIPGADLADAERQISAIGAEIEDVESRLEQIIANNSKVGIIELAQERAKLSTDFWERGAFRGSTASGLPTLDFESYFTQREDARDRMAAMWDGFDVQEKKRLVEALYRVEVGVAVDVNDSPPGTTVQFSDLGNGGKRYTITTGRRRTTRHVDFLPVRHLRAV